MELKKGFVVIADRANDQITLNILYQIEQHFNRKAFFDVHLEDVIDKIIVDNNKIISRLHDRFTRKLWKSIIDQVIVLYF
jgi:hypothetical protein